MGNQKRNKLIKWHQELRSAAAARARAWAASPALRELSSVARPSVSPSSESPSLLSADSQEEVASRESPPTSTRRPALFSDPSSRTLSATPLSTPNTPRERPSPLSTSSTLSSVRAEPSTASAAEHPETSVLSRSVSPPTTFTNSNRHKK